MITGFNSDGTGASLQEEKISVVEDKSHEAFIQLPGEVKKMNLGILQGEFLNTTSDFFQRIREWNF